MCHDACGFVRRLLLPVIVIHRLTQGISVRIAKLAKNHCVAMDEVQNLTFYIKMPTVEGRWANLMFSQRNNPYCDLLKNVWQI